jgi:hypothetical protein
MRDEVKASGGGYNRNYWHAVVATMSVEPIDPLFSCSLHLSIPGARFGDLVIAGLFRSGMPPHEIAAYVCQSPKFVADALWRARLAVKQAGRA